MLPVVISFYTNDWEYPQHAIRLTSECLKLNLKYVIKERPSKGGYLENTCQKPFFIRECLRSLNAPVLWVDVDASIYKRPIFFDGLDADVSLKHKDPKKYRRKYHVGTMWFNNTPMAYRLLDLWCERVGSLSDESTLEDIYSEIESEGCRIVDMPVEYHEIQKRDFRILADTVIMHRLSKGESKKKQRARFGGIK